MRKKLERRLEELRSEFNAGQKRLTELETQKLNLRETLLRISGAIQVLEEELANASRDEAGDEISAQDTVLAMRTGGKEKK